MGRVRLGSESGKRAEQAKKASSPDHQPQPGEVGTDRSAGMRQRVEVGGQKSS